MAQQSKAIPINRVGRTLVSEAAEVELRTRLITVNEFSVTLLEVGGEFQDRRKLFIRNKSEFVVYVGDANVTSSTGFPLYLRDEIELDVDLATKVYGLAGGGNGEVTVTILEAQ